MASDPRRSFFAALATCTLVADTALLDTSATACAEPPCCCAVPGVAGGTISPFPLPDRVMRLLLFVSSCCSAADRREPLPSVVPSSTFPFATLSTTPSTTIGTTVPPLPSKASPLRTPALPLLLASEGCSVSSLSVSV
uniref:Putative secreted protein n=1 Tax=Anopheles darlingi TaxID=43151 RepID=A0A2M4DJ13_ANODA